MLGSNLAHSAVNRNYLLFEAGQFDVLAGDTCLYTATSNARRLAPLVTDTGFISIWDDTDFMSIPFNPVY